MREPPHRPEPEKCTFCAIVLAMLIMAVGYVAIFEGPALFETLEISLLGMDSDHG